MLGFKAWRDIATQTLNALCFFLPVRAAEGQRTVADHVGLPSLSPHVRPNGECPTDLLTLRGGTGHLTVADHGGIHILAQHVRADGECPTAFLQELLGSLLQRALSASTD